MLVPLCYGLLSNPKRKKLKKTQFPEVDQFWCMKCGRTRGWNISSEGKGKVSKSPRASRMGRFLGEMPCFLKNFSLGTD